MTLRKTMDRWDIETNYGYGWEVECSEYTKQDARKQLKCYLDNSPGAAQLTKHREKITRLYYYGAQTGKSGCYPKCPGNYAGWGKDKSGKYQAIVAYGRSLEEREVSKYNLTLLREEDVA